VRLLWLARLGAELGKGPEASAPQLSKQCRNSSSAALVDIKWDVGGKTVGGGWRGVGRAAGEVIAELIVAKCDGQFVVFLGAARWQHCSMAIRCVA
jgi:hypothetical protein